MAGKRMIVGRARFGLLLALVVLLQPACARADEGSAQVLREQSPAEKRRAIEDAEARRGFFEHGAGGLDRQGTGTLRGARYQGDLNATLSDDDTMLGVLGRGARGEAPVKTEAEEHRATLEVMDRVRENGAP